MVGKVVKMARHFSKPQTVVILHNVELTIVVLVIIHLSKMLLEISYPTVADRFNLRLVGG